MSSTSETPNTNRYSIKAPDAVTYGKVKDGLNGHAEIMVELPKRLILSVAGLTEAGKKFVEESGATLRVEAQYQIDAASPNSPTTPIGSPRPRTLSAT